ncbi:MAG: tRNA-uridine aminocarboxypropyltransferase [Planctomycetota bacterium]|nr:tRNA-uridine aminocarboxypropyltransferase [Planctomycetota bacterium]
MLRRNPRKTGRDKPPTCRICGLWEKFCVCHLLPHLDSRLRLLLIQHSSELLRQSNTGRLVEKMVSPSEMVFWGAENTPFPANTLERPATNYLVLYPRSNARMLEPGDLRADPGSETCLVLLDATWAQAKSMSRRIPGLEKLPFVSLPQEETPAWKLRRSPTKGYCCTLEAAYRALAIVEGENFARPLLLSLELVMTKSLHMRGKLTKTEMERTCAPLVAELSSI